MKKSLVAAKPIEPSKELERFFGDPPLIGNERLEDYLALFSMIAALVSSAPFFVPANAETTSPSEAKEIASEADRKSVV